MPIDKSVIAALEKAVEAEPENKSLRLHLAFLLYDDEQFQSALAHCRTILNREPANLDALEKAAQSAEKLGEASVADGYRRLLDALRKTTAAPPADSYRQDSWSEFIDDAPRTGKIPLEETFGDAENEDDSVWEIERSDLRLEDVAGMEKVKRRLHPAFLAPLKNPEMMRLYGKSLRGGLLLYGAPGCGKT